MGSDGASFHTKKNSIIEVEPEREELGFVGIPKKIKANLIEDALNKNKIPIIAPLGLDKSNQTFNINGCIDVGTAKIKPCSCWSYTSENICFLSIIFNDHTCLFPLWVSCLLDNK